MDKITNDNQSRLPLDVKRERISIKQTALVSAIVVMTLYKIFEGYLTAGFDPSIFRNGGYWATLITSNLAVIMITLIARASRRDKLIASSESIKECRQSIGNAHRIIAEQGLTGKLDAVIEAQNVERKRNAIRAQQSRRLRFYGEKKLFRRAAARANKMLCDLESGSLNLSGYKIKYNKIDKGVLYSSEYAESERDESFEIRESAEVARLIVRKLLAVVAFTALGQSVVFEWAMGDIVPALIKTFMSLIQTAWAIVLGCTDADRFVNGILRSKLLMRQDYLRAFIDEQNVEAGA